MSSGKGGHRSFAGTAIATVAVLAVVLGACVASAWEAGAFLPDWVRWSCTEQAADLDGDGLSDTVVTSARRLSVVDGAGRRYQAPADWLVADAHVGDVTRDGTPDVIAIVWKRGSFGTSKPFWIERDSTAFSEHVFILDYADGALEQVWMSSALGFEARSSSLDGDGRLHLTDGQGAETVWEWQSWGLALADEAAPGGRASRETEADANDASSANGACGADVRNDGGAPAGRGASTLTLLAAGDVIAHDSMIADARSHDGNGGDGDGDGSSSSDDGPSYDFSPLFSRVEDRVRRSDIAVVNQETPFVRDPRRFAGWPRFGTPPALGDALADAGFDVVTAATNHAYDQGEDGIADTIGFWRGEHPEVTLLGLHESAAEAAACDYVECNGIRLALLDAAYGLNGAAPPGGRDYEIDLIGDGARLVGQVEASERKADATVCFLHAGEEYSAFPSDELRTLCGRLVDAGADAVICTHPHVLQSAEVLRTESGAEGVVFWSLGNFASNQLRADTVLGAAAELTFEKTGSGTSVSSYALVPTACHFERGLTQVFWLEDYTDELARRHYINTLGDENAVTLDRLREQFAGIWPDERAEP